MELCTYGEGRSQTERFHTETKDDIFHKTVHFYWGMNGVWVPSLIIDLFSGRMLSRLYLSHENGSGRQFNFRNGIALILFYSSEGLRCLERVVFSPVSHFSWILFFACHIPFCYLCGASLTVSDLPPLRSSVWPLGRRFFFFLSLSQLATLRKIGKKFHTTQIIICSLEGWCCGRM